jgi:hypothetical protein
MKRIGATLAALALTGGIALAQTSGTGTGSMGGASTGGAASPGPNPPAPSDIGTTGRAPGTNPANSQDVSRRGNLQDTTLPRGINPQNMKGLGVPQIYVPERGR